MALNVYSTEEFAKKISKTKRTLYKWRREGKLVPLKGFDGAYYYTDEHLAQYFGISLEQLYRSSSNPILGGNEEEQDS